MGTWLPETCWATCKGEIKDNTKVTSSWYLIHTELRCTVNHTSNCILLHLVGQLLAYSSRFFLWVQTLLPEGRTGEAWKNPKKRRSFGNRGKLYEKSCRPDTAEARIPSQAIPSEIYSVRCGIGTVFSPGTSVFPYQYHSINAPYSFLSTCCSYQKVK